ncbi:MAG: molybdopterin molybdotransferase MoeA [Acidobacteria bacterium]|nr:molybdopterin molybdotransferase MoeA [Acidobacteriota bacterium]
MKDLTARMIGVDEALGIVLRETSVLPAESIVLESAAGRVLAEEVFADADQPPFAKAMMDGFALRSMDVTAAPAELEVVEEVPAGRMPTHTLGEGQAARIMTGAPLPEGADAVQMVEKTEPAMGGRWVRILEVVQAGAHVAPRGRELRAGQRVLAPGDDLTPSRIGVLSGVGKGTVLAHRRPRVAVAPTGDELVHWGATPKPGQIRNSNGPALSAACRQLGAEVLELGIIRDDAAALGECLRKGLASDLLLLSGGVSMGTYDLVEGALDREGVEIFFRKVAIRPGKPAVFGRKRNCLVFGLPGNPVSSLVIFQVLVAPSLRKMQGGAMPQGREMEALLEAPVVQHTGRTSYLPGTLRFEGESARIQPIPSSGSADLPAYSRANALLVIPADRDRVEAGEKLRVLPLD